MAKGDMTDAEFAAGSKIARGASRNDWGKFSALWRQLCEDVNAVPCQWPDLRDSLHDWLRSKGNQGAKADSITDLLKAQGFEG